MKLQPLTLARFVVILAVLSVLTAPAWGNPVFTTSVDFGGNAGLYFTALPYDPGYSLEVFASLFGKVALNPDPPVPDAPVTPYTFQSSDTITITVIQAGHESDPIEFSGVFSGTYGNLTLDAPSDPVFLTFGVSSQAIGAAIYTIAPSHLEIAADADKQTDITGDVATPEPSGFGLLAVALVGFGFFRRRKPAANQAGL